MMVSSNPMPLLSLTLAIVMIFSVTLVENLEVADGFSSIATNLEYNMQVGETQLLTWGIINDDQENPLYLDMYATGPGSELFVFEEDIVIEPGAIKYIEIFVQVPEDHPDNLAYYPQVFALKIKEHAPDADDFSAKININIQHVTKPIIRIGDNPVEFIPEVANEEVAEDTPDKEPTAIVEEEVEDIPGETMAEKLERIKAANEAKQGMQEIEPMEEIDVDVDPGYTQEPEADPEAADFEEELQACGFWEWFLGLFGIKSDCI